jgi:hypothetical protein
VPLPAELAGEVDAKRSELIEAVAEVDEGLAERFLLEEPIDGDALRDAVRRSVLALKFVPVFMGSAFKNRGVQLLLDGVTDYLPSPLDVDNFALDLERGEEKVLLPCSRWAPAQLREPAQYRHVCSNLTTSCSACLSAKPLPGGSQTPSGPLERGCGRQACSRTAMLTLLPSALMCAPPALHFTQEGAAGGLGLQAGGGPLRPAHLHAHLLGWAAALRAA